jgi:hypothetical protein
MYIYKELPNGVKLAEYDDSMAQAVANLWKAGGDGLSFDVDRNTAAICTFFPAWAENGGGFTAKPAFLIITPQDLKAEMLSDLDRVVFK